VRPVIIWLFVAALIVLAIVYYGRKNSSGDLNVDPNAAREIEKAKRH